MAHSVSYVVFVSGVEFCRLGVLAQHPPPMELSRLLSSGGFWDGSLKSHPLEVLVGFLMGVTLVWLPEKYTRFLIDSEVRGRVLAWERELLSLLPPAVRVARVDEFLLDEFETENWDAVIRSEDMSKELSRWLSLQDSRHWAWLAF